MNGTNKKEARLWGTELQGIKFLTRRIVFIIHPFVPKRKENQWKKNSAEIVL